jgi:hypothetical protein
MARRSQHKYCQLSYEKEGARCGIVVKVLRYKPAGRGFDSRWCHWHNPSGRAKALGRLSL